MTSVSATTKESNTIVTPIPIGSATGIDLKDIVE